MGTQLMMHIWDRATVGGGELVALMALAELGEDDGTRVCATIAMIAERARMSVDQTRRNIHKLIADGVVELVAEGGRVAGRNTPNEYRIILDGPCKMQGQDSRNASPWALQNARAGTREMQGDGLAKCKAENSTDTRVGACEMQGPGTREMQANMVGWLVDPTTRSRKKPTNPQTPKTPPIDKHQQLALDLLVDAEVGIDHQLAEILARKLPPQVIYKAVERWLPEYQTGAVETGALVYRLNRAKPIAEAVTLSSDFRASELYRRYPLPPEMVADPNRRDYSADREWSEPHRNYCPPEYADIIIGAARPRGDGEP